MLTGMARVVTDGLRVWHGAADEREIPPVYFAEHEILVERTRIRSINILKSVRINIDGHIAYDEAA